MITFARNVFVLSRTEGFGVTSDRIRLERLAPSQAPYHMKVFLSHYPLGVVHAKPKSLIQPFGRHIVHLNQERHAKMSKLAGLFTPRFDQEATVSFPLATRTHAEGIQVKLRGFRFGGDPVIGMPDFLAAARSSGASSSRALAPS